jgi:hypothetical protein
VAKELFFKKNQSRTDKPQKFTIRHYFPQYRLFVETKTSVKASKPLNPKPPPETYLKGWGEIITRVAL